VRLYIACGFGLNLFMAFFIAMIPPCIAAFYLQRHAPRWADVLECFDAPLQSFLLSS
jgi:hypothetical protein